MESAEDEWASVKEIPECVRLSMFGGWILDSGLNAEISPYPKSSANMNITLGDCAFTAVAARSAEEIVISLFITFD